MFKSEQSEDNFRLDLIMALIEHKEETEFTHEDYIYLLDIVESVWLELSDSETEEEEEGEYSGDAVEADSNVFITNFNFYGY